MWGVETSGASGLSFVPPAKALNLFPLSISVTHRTTFRLYGPERFAPPTLMRQKRLWFSAQGIWSTGLTMIRNGTSGLKQVPGSLRRYPVSRLASVIKRMNPATDLSRGTQNGVSHEEGIENRRTPAQVTESPREETRYGEDRVAALAGNAQLGLLSKIRPVAHFTVGSCGYPTGGTNLLLARRVSGDDVRRPCIGTLPATYPPFRPNEPKLDPGPLQEPFGQTHRHPS